jgi:hypothetical protein
VEVSAEEGVRLAVPVALDAGSHIRGDLVPESGDPRWSVGSEVRPWKDAHLRGDVYLGKPREVAEQTLQILSIADGTVMISFQACSLDYDQIRSYRLRLGDADYMLSCTKWDEGERLGHFDVSCSTDPTVANLACGEYSVMDQHTSARGTGTVHCFGVLRVDHVRACHGDHVHMDHPLRVPVVVAGAVETPACLPATTSSLLGTPGRPFHQAYVRSVAADRLAVGTSQPAAVALDVHHATDTADAPPYVAQFCHHTTRAGTRADPQSVGIQFATAADPIADSIADATAADASAVAASSTWTARLVASKEGAMTTFRVVHNDGTSTVTGTSVLETRSDGVVVVRGRVVSSLLRFEDHHNAPTQDQLLKHQIVEFRLNRNVTVVLPTQGVVVGERKTLLVTERHGSHALSFATAVAGTIRETSTTTHVLWVNDAWHVI